MMVSTFFWPRKFENFADRYFVQLGVGKVIFFGSPFSTILFKKKIKIEGEVFVSYKALTLKQFEGVRTPNAPPAYAHNYYYY